MMRCGVARVFDLCPIVMYAGVVLLIPVAANRMGDDFQADYVRVAGKVYHFTQRHVARPLEHYILLQRGLAYRENFVPSALQSQDI